MYTYRSQNMWHVARLAQTHGVDELVLVNAFRWCLYVVGEHNEAQIGWIVFPLLPVARDTLPRPAPWCSPIWNVIASFTVRAFFQQQHPRDTMCRLWLECEPWRRLEGSFLKSAGIPPASIREQHNGWFGGEDDDMGIYLYKTFRHVESSLALPAWSGR